MANIEMNVLKVGDSEFEIADAQARQDVSTLKEDFHEYHSELGAGYADQLVSGIENTDQTPYNFRKVPYDATLEQVEGIVGCDVVVNQLINHGNFDASGSWFEYDCTYTFADGVATVTPTGATSRIFQTRDVVLGHKYFMIATFKGTSGEGNAMLSWYGGVNVFVPFTGSWQTISMIADNTFQTSNVWQLHYGSTFNKNKVPYMVKDAMCFDLTAMFGTAIADYAYGLETATAGAGVAWLKKHFPKIFNSGYIPSNTGELVSVAGVSEKKNVGFNQCAENWRQGDWNNASPKRVALVNTDRIPLIGGQTYYISCSSPDNSYRVSCAVLENIDSTSYFEAIGFSTGATYIASKNCYLAPVVMRSDDSAITPEEVKANCKVCINISDPARNGEYEPYEEHTYPLDSTIDLHGILKLDANNQLYADGDVYKADGTVNRRYGVVDLGTLEWHAISGYAGYFKAVTTEVVNIDNGVVANALCPKYVTVKGNDLASKDKAIAVGMNNAYEIQISDSAYSTASASDFRNALAGVMLLYKKRLFTTETAEPYRQKQICDPSGTEEYVSTSVVPVGHETRYPLDIAGRLDKLLKMPDTNGTYTLQATVTDGKVAYSWVSA